MTSTTLTQGRDEAADAVTPAELIQRAIDMRPRLLERQEETESLGHYPEATHREFIENGLYRLIQPRRYGGHEVDVATFYQILIELARGCPSTSWCFGLGVSHQMTIASHYSEQAQEEIFGGPEGYALIPSTIAPPPERAERVDGGYLVRGKFPYASGSAYSTHYLGHVVGPDGKLLQFIAPRSIYTVLDDWGDVFGMRGSGSHSVQVDGFVPDHYVTVESQFNLSVDGGTFGSRLHDNPMYAIKTLGYMTGEVVSVAVGTALAALDEYTKLAKTRPVTWVPAQLSGGAPPEKMPLKAESEVVQRDVGRAIVQLAGAEAIVIRVGQQIMESGLKNVELGHFPQIWDTQFCTMLTYAGSIAEATLRDPLVRTVGTTSVIRQGQRMQRYVRDMTTYWSHGINTNYDMFRAFLGRQALGVEEKH